MDPWADTSTSTPWSPQARVQPASPSPAAEVSSAFGTGPVDPWAESNTSAAESSVTTLHRRDSNNSSRFAHENLPGSVGDFDPWGGNSAPIAPLYTAFDSNTSGHGEVPNTQDEEAPRAQWSGQEEDNGEQTGSRASEEIARNTTITSEEQEPETTLVDDDDPWGSGAAARRIKAQQEAESAAQRMEILRLQEEAKGKQMDNEGNEIQVKQEESTIADKTKEDLAPEVEIQAPVASSGWRSLFSRGAAKGAINEEAAPAKEAALKVDTAVASNGSPLSSSVLPAPRLWQAPAILGTHARSNSSSSRTNGTIKEVPPSTTPPIKGPGWEVTTKKQQGSAGGGGIIQSLFGSSITANDDDKVTVTTVPKKLKTTGLNRFGRGLQAPAVVSAVDDEEDSFDTEETGVEWEAGHVFDGKGKQMDLLSDDAEDKPPESAVGKLLGRWRAKEAPAKNDAEEQTKVDFSWLESVGESKSAAGEKKVEKVDDDTDWLALMNKQNNTISSSSITPLARSNSDRMRISSTSRGTISTKTPATATPSLLPPPSTKMNAGQRTASPFSFRGPGTAMSSSLSASRLASSSNVRLKSTQDTFIDFMDDSAAPNDGYRDDVTDNDAALLQSRPEQPKKSDSFLRGLQRNNHGSRYDYNEDDVDSHDDNWSAFRDDDDDIQSSAHQDHNRRRAASPPIAPFVVSSASIVKSKIGSSSMSGPIKSINTALPPPPTTTWNRHAPLLPPPSRPISTDQMKQASPLPPTTILTTKPMTLSQGKTLTNDDLSFFESL